MKRLVTSYAFFPVEKTIVFPGYSAINLDGVLLITNVTDHIIVYNFADSALTGTVSGNVLTLSYDTSGMDAADNLQIWYDDGLLEQQSVDSILVDRLDSILAELQDLRTGLILADLIEEV